MRTTLASTLVLSLASLALAACSATPAEVPPTTVRGALAADGATLAVAPTSTGAINARLWRTGWEDDVVALAIESGELVVSTDASGNLLVEDLGVAIAPIELSPEVFSEPTSLVDLRAELAADAPVAVTTWTGADRATATTTVSLRLTWAMRVGDRVSPLGPITLRDLPITLTLAGGATQIDATVGLDADGTLWSWAGLIELADLSLALTARSTPAE